jgi:hypothetical protein
VRNNGDQKSYEKTGDKEKSDQEVQVRPFLLIEPAEGFEPSAGSGESTYVGF